MSYSSPTVGRPPRRLLQALASRCRRPLRRGVKASGADYYVKSYFSVGLALALISYFLLDLKSLRELRTELRVNSLLASLTGFGGISNAHLPKLLHDRPGELWTPLLTSLLRQVPAAQVPRPLRIFDTTFLTMGLKLFSRQHSNVKCTAHTAGYKAGVVWNPQQAAPVKLVCRAGQSNDAQYLSELLPKQETISQAVYLFDRGFRKYAFWDELIDRGAGFVTRAWRLLHFEVTLQLPLEAAHPQLLSDEIGHVGGQQHRMRHPLRRIVMQTKRGQLVFLTTELEQSAWEITELYRLRWQIEIFFRWLKRILNCRKALAMSVQAAVHTLCAAFATYLLLLIFAQRALPKEELQGLPGLKIALRILRSRLYQPPGKALLKCLGFL
jgi:Transposase DDE domain